MLLVLGRPGSGCTTLLNMLSNRRHGYKEIKGEVRFGSMNEVEAHQYRGQIVMNTEDELFFPVLTVGQTIDFATRMKMPTQTPSDFATPDEYGNAVKKFILETLGIAHTSNTMVGNEFIRGVSGGERKRLSIAEVFSTEASIYCWDNSTRGLDASTALDWVRCLRAMTDILGLTTVVTLYQAGNGIFNLFDKVLVLDGGKEIYYGPREEAQPYMESLGFVCDDGANVGDFLTGVTVPTERQVRPENFASFPRNAEEIEAIYNKSEIKMRMDKESDYSTRQSTLFDTQQFQEAMAERKSKGLSQGSPFTVSFGQQVMTLTIRQYQLLWGDKPSLLMRHASTLIQALLAGSLFYGAPANSNGLFIKGGVLFWSTLYHCLVAMSETITTFFGRPILAKHKEFAFYHPAAFCLAQIVADIPGLVFQVTLWAVIVYWMATLRATAEAFFTYWVVILANTFCMTAFFRLCGAAFPTFDAASKISGFVINAIATYTGFMIPKPEMHPWFVWIYWINPLSYTYEALAVNEFHNTVIPCVNNNLVPSGEGYTTEFASCTGVRGAEPGETYVTGDQYLASLSYSYSHLWRNFGIIWTWTLLFVGLTIICTTGWESYIGGGVHLVPRERVVQNRRVQPNDEESHTSSNTSSTLKTETNFKNNPNDSESTGKPLLSNTSVFTWKNLSYTVKTHHGDRKLLDNVSGWVKPGMLGALMGSSGAGKTTLMDVLAQRKTEGTITGSVLVDGRELPVSFQRSAGYCEQFDVHEPFSTVREALEFSALLRQSRERPDVEKLAYVDTVIDLLELRDLEHSLIGRPGAGLSIEQRKRVSIGVELVAKPSILIFLDEPTSGLDGQAAYNTMRFLRKLTSAGQAVLCTIHQPSAQIFSQFDTLLLLGKGGKTVYFGDIGPDAATLKGYFAQHGAPCPPSANPAEHMIDVVSGTSSNQDWHHLWLDSPEHKQSMTDLDNMVQTASSKPPATKDDGYEFAASMITQTRIVTHRMNTALYRNTDYIMNKIMLHVVSGLFNGFTFWKIGNNVKDLQNTLFAIFNFIFVAPGVVAQLQPVFIDRRDIFEIREKKSKTYHWAPFVTGLIVSEIPYLIISGFSTDVNKAGGVFFVMIMYEFLYTGIGQFIAAYAPNAVFASMVNPLIISTMISFCGVLVPYSELQAFWRYWIYYLNPFTYLMGSLINFALFDKTIECTDSELAIFNPPANESCGKFLFNYLQGPGSGSNLLNPDATSDCRVCQYASGTDYLYTLNVKDFYYAWSDAAIVVIFVLSSYGLVYGFMKLRTKATKKAQ
ncbi:ABC transporter ATP-binding protein/permease PDR18 [Fusarium oxysporum f. sp. cubense race 1]|uniref:ABC transporter ATP-binding protein/permease PDR18 n=1 Tax=Fusarium oxysporum f. sp. cubense (strain race 1) TaxID=1229664 RepID=N4UE32_FUSC1|nr:ABC transporter ATP-binding protein/permease PDR18 [Fusarium oxysporum f. sp. cubense race 1]